MGSELYAEGEEPRRTTIPCRKTVRSVLAARATIRGSLLLTTTTPAQESLRAQVSVSTGSHRIEERPEKRPEQNRTVSRYGTFILLGPFPSADTTGLCIYFAGTCSLLRKGKTDGSVILTEILLYLWDLF